MSRKQEKILKYVVEGNLLKLKSYLSGNRDVKLDFSRGKKGRSVLHLACSHREGDIVSLLLRHGANALHKDRKGNTPLHIAAKRARKHGKTDYNDMVVPLKAHCPAAMDEPNNAGVTPRDLLNGIRFGQNWQPKPLHDGDAAEQEWQEKLFGECADEFFEAFGKYDDDFVEYEDEDEDFGDWADQIRREYEAKQRAWKRGCGTSSRHRKRKLEEEEEDERRRKETQKQLEKEHAEYLQRAARKEEETKQGRKRLYEKRCTDTFHSSSASQGMLGYDDIPWPAPRGSTEEMVAVMLHGVDRSDVANFRKFLLRQQTLWHPDKFTQRCGERLKEKERQKILNTVTALSQELNKLAQRLQ